MGLARLACLALASRSRGGGQRLHEGCEALKAREARGAAVAQRSEQTGLRRLIGSGLGVGSTCGVVGRRRHAAEAPPRRAAGQVCEQHALILS